jgi:hypothetical protein
MDEGVLEAARVIRWYLPELVGPAAEEVDLQLAGLLAAMAGGEDVKVRVRAVLEGHVGTRVFLEAVLEDAPEYRPPQVKSGSHRTAGYSPLPGDPGPIPADKFYCPDGDYVWYQQAVGVPVPECKTHHRALVPA